MTGHSARNPVDLERITLPDGPAPGTKAAARNARMPADKHGTPAGYSYWGCRRPCCCTPEKRRRGRYPNRR
ncbi:MAG: hypothetical protein AB7G17_14655 [Phycisphaerales bacterium]